MTTRGVVKFINPSALNKNPAFTNVVVVSGSVKTIYIGGQDSVDASAASSGRGTSEHKRRKCLRISRRPLPRREPSYTIWSSGTSS